MQIDTVYFLLGLAAIAALFASLLYLDFATDADKADLADYLSVVHPTARGEAETIVRETLATKRLQKRHCRNAYNRIQRLNDRAAVAAFEAPHKASDLIEKVRTGTRKA